MSNINLTQKTINRPFFNLDTPAALLTVSGVALIGGYWLHLVGFGSWLTLAVAGAILLAAIARQATQARLAIPAVVVAIEGAILCTMALPDQLGHSEFIAAVANLAIITMSIAAAALILRRPQ